MNIFNTLKEDVVKATLELYPNCLELAKQAAIETPKDPLNGDLSTNIAMIIASREATNPREIALKLKDILSGLPYIAHIEIAGGGFLNFTIKANIWHDCARSILAKADDFWSVNVGNGKKINIEYVSANPTGPMHIGHARGAVYGDALANLLKYCGYEVTKEYYINDAGSQINTLVNTVLLRYEEALSGVKAKIPEGYYPGDYLIPVGQKLAQEFGDSLRSMDEVEQYKAAKKVAIAEMLIMIKSDLKDLGIEHDIFFSEQILHEERKIEQTIELLTTLGLIYEGQLPPPKGKIDENWSERPQTLFKSSQYGDDQDRAVKKSDGSWTYLAADLAYAKNKIDRGFDSLIYVLGADHSGYIKRINAVVKALGQDKVHSDVKICQLVNFIADGMPVKMSKRSGNFTTVKDVTDEVGKDVIRFMMLTRKNDAPLDFDLEKVKEQSKDNPVFYVQYANVRSLSILANAMESTPEAYAKFKAGEFDLSLLSSEEEIQLIKLLSSWSKVLEGAAKHFEPHRIAFFLLSVAAKFHSIWNLGKENNDYRFVIEGNIELTAARLALVKSIQLIIQAGFEVIGVTPLQKM